ncbi:unnamed protein product [Fusarium graminearum]|uniref:Chromosome 1, complete genome n=1 Tax=Gibberella zeae (strain ATCC MYA-4620 / CBS 123657 / FGSC 9075 / NRRL 31084 / PH-1) TaxID=229533 RepID=A0A1C3YIA3_GIBZE|nr:unnamed protein product [Fusarium graminearum]
MAFGSSKNRQPRLIFVSLDGTLAGNLLSPRQTVISVLPKLISKSHNVVLLPSNGPGSDISHTDRFLGGLCGWGTRRNVIAAYKLLAQTYQPGDNIILSGYSRGAWAARYLALIIEAIGLPEQSVNHKFFHLLYQECDKNPNFESTVTPELNKFVCHRDVEIEALCCFDTVGSLGLPLYGILRPLELIHRGRSRNDMVSNVAHNVKNAFHCLSIHETRAPYYPTYMRGRNVHQVFFPGNHSQLGWIDEQESFVHAALAWMIQQLHSHADIRFNDNELKKYFQMSQYPQNRIQHQESGPCYPWLSERVAPRQAVVLALMGKKVRRLWKVPCSNTERGSKTPTHRIYEAPVGKLEAELLGLSSWDGPCCDEPKKNWWDKVRDKFRTGNVLEQLVSI